MDFQRIKFPSVAEMYSKDSKLKKDDVEVIEKWLKAQPHLPEVTQFQMVMFLHSCYYEVPAAQTTIENYFTFRTKSFLINNVDEDLVRRALAMAFLSPLPNKTPDDNIVILLRFIDFNTERFNCVEILKVFLAILTVHVHQSDPANGVILVCDSEGVSLGHLLKTSISAVKQFLYFVQEAAPIRLKGISLINSTPITGRLISLTKPFLTKETYNLINVHYSLDTFHEVVPKECLPKELDGLLPSIHELQEINLRNIVDHRNVLQWHETQKVDESQRIKKDHWLRSSMQKIFS